MEESGNSEVIRKRAGRCSSHVFTDAEGSGADVVPTLHFQPLLMNVGDFTSIMQQLVKIKDILES